MGPDQEALEADLKSPAFRLGVLRGKWELAHVRFPLVFLRVSAPARAEGPAWFLLAANCNGYPAQAPTAQLWDGRDDKPLEESLRPRGQSGVLIAFKNWNNCLYHPIDRLARSHWPNDHADLAWRRDSDITHFLETVHGLIDVAQYLGASAPDAAAFLSKDGLESAADRAA